MVLETPVFLATGDRSNISVARNHADRFLVSIRSSILGGSKHDESILKPLGYFRLILQLHHEGMPHPSYNQSSSHHSQCTYKIVNLSDILTYHPQPPPITEITLILTSRRERLRPKLFLQISPEFLNHLLLWAPHPRVNFVAEEIDDGGSVHSVGLGVYEGAAEVFDTLIADDVFIVVVFGVELGCATACE